MDDVRSANRLKLYGHAPHLLKWNGYLENHRRTSWWPHLTPAASTVLPRGMLPCVLRFATHFTSEAGQVMSYGPATKGAFSLAPKYLAALAPGFAILTF